MKKTTKLLCFPFAGGNKYSYRVFSEMAPSFVEIITLEYPGRATRVDDPLLTDITLLAEDMVKQILPYLDGKEYAIYGHSMGGLLAYLVTLQLAKNNYKLPVHIFITGTSGPSAVSRTEDVKRYLLEKQEFIEEIRALDGMPEEILTSEELLMYFEPILRADFEASETYTYTQQEEPLDIPVTVITGIEEDIEPEDIKVWQQEFKRPIDFKRLPGKHFFIFQHTFKIIEIISKKLYLHKIPS